jgi:cell division septal protein FtsQ
LALPAKRIEIESDKPPIDPTAIPRAYERERASRKMRVERARARKRAHLRFHLTMLVMLVIVVVIAMLIWRETQTLFGI